jgi:DMSO/TMAO reductase YedYZ molybdopterin-dependent catalytic subunit
MEPENNIPDGESKVGDAKAGDREAVKLNHGTPEAAEPSVVASAAVESKPIQAETVQSKLVQTESVQPELVRPGMSDRRFAQVSRRELLKVAPVLLLGAFAIPRFQESLLNTGLGFSDWMSARLFRRGHLAPTFAEAELTPFEKFPINGYDVEDPGVIFENWTLTVSGAVQKPGDYMIEQIQALPRVRHNTRHICVEGWDVIGRFGGARLSDFLSMIGADISARFISVACADDYYESLDMATALHPQTLLCYEMYDQPLTRKHGAPLRLNVPTKVGYKQAKYLTELKVTNVLEKVGYWEDQGYSEFYGL